MADETATATRDKVDVKFAIQVSELDSLPPSSRGRRSPLHDLINQVKELVEGGTVNPGRPVMVANYGKATSAQSTATSLRHMYGKDATASGISVAVRKVEIEGAERAGLFVMYDPSKITAEGKAQHEVDLAEYNRVQAERRKKYDAQKAQKAANEAANGKSKAAASAK